MGCFTLFVFLSLLYVHSSFFWFCNHLDGEERTGCFTLFVFLVSRDCCVAVPHDAMGLSAIVIVVFPDHAHLLFSIVLISITLF